MPRKRRKPEPVADTQAEQVLIVYLEERAAQPGDAPLTAEEFIARSRRYGGGQATRRAEG
jgi:hypothetical protein